MASLEERRQVVIERIARREDMRKAEEERRKREKAENACGGEHPDTFQTRFQAERSVALDELERADSVPPGPQLIDLLDRVSERADALGRYLTQSALFLPPFDMEQARLELQALQTSISQKRDQLMPKKKFAFGSRAKKTGPVKPTNSAASVQAVVETGKNSSQIVWEGGCGFLDQKGPGLVLEKQGVEIAGQDIFLSNLSHCEVRLVGHPGAVTANGLSHVRLLCGPVSGAIFLEDCENCSLFLACHQLRVHTTRDSLLSVHVTSRPIIEQCSGLKFAPYLLNYPAQKEDFVAAGLQRDTSYWDKVEDFYHLASDVPSPNWSVLPPDEREEVSL